MFIITPNASVHTFKDKYTDFNKWIIETNEGTFMGEFKDKEDMTAFEFFISELINATNIQTQNNAINETKTIDDFREEN